MLQGLQPELPHPLRLGLHVGDLFDDFLGEPPLRREHVVRGILPAEAVPLGQFLEMLFLRYRHGTSPSFASRRLIVATGQSTPEVYLGDWIRNPRSQA